MKISPKESFSVKVNTVKIATVKNGKMWNGFWKSDPISKRHYLQNNPKYSNSNPFKVRVN